MHHPFLYISLPFLHNYDVKMRNFSFYGEHKQVKESKFSAGLRCGGSQKRKQMPESLDLFNIFVHGAGERLDQRSKRSLAVVSFRSFIEKPLLAG